MSAGDSQPVDSSAPPQRQQQVSAKPSEPSPLKQTPPPSSSTSAAAGRRSGSLSSSGSGPASLPTRDRDAGHHADNVGVQPSTGIQVVQPSTFLGSYVRPRAIVTEGPMTPATATQTTPPRPLSLVDREQIEGLRAIRAFLKVRTSYDVLPLSFRLIVFDTALLVKKSLNILIQNGIVSAPLWDSRTSTFAGLLTTSDYLNVIQYYWQNPDELKRIDQFRLDSLREIEKAIGAPQIETVSIHPEKPLYEAMRKMLTSRARRIPLIDFDDETKRATVVSVVTQYRILKFVAVNVKETQMLKKPLKELRMGSYTDLQTANMDTPVMDVIHMLVKKNISSVPILDKDGTVINVFESVDVIALIKGGIYEDLDLTVGEALLKRSDDFAGIYTCSIWDRLDTIFDTLRKSRVHRLVVLDENGRLKGILSLSDILEYILLEGESEGG
ncbi:CBS-domain-containing protein [Tothia fuscella]|uniref:CBS-domain-containing protein n=1 Tax=Tothia fuscella TaxID=1048955 RepID=A0A9P4TT47_9PEZI|nr:CBS-domain-containing protein [Tothia fuscella]